MSRGVSEVWSKAVAVTVAAVVAVAVALAMAVLPARVRPDQQLPRDDPIRFRGRPDVVDLPVQRKVAGASRGGKKR